MGASILSRCVRSWLTAGRRGAGYSASDSGLPLGAPPSRPDRPKYVAWDGNRAQRGSGALAVHKDLEQGFWPAGGGSWGWRWGTLSRIGPRVYTSLNGSVGEFEGALGLGPKLVGVIEASGCPSHRAGRAGSGVGLTPLRKGPEPRKLSPLQTTGPVSLTSSKPHSNGNLTPSP